ncbi:Squalene/phytoene synthase-like protein, partial [Leptotrombidium deliense]
MTLRINDLLRGFAWTQSAFCRKYDFENYLATALINDSFMRRTAFAVRALNVELSQIRDLTTNETSAQMRFQFWLRLITDIFEGIEVPTASSGSQPIAAEIQKCFLASQKTLSKRWFLCLIESRMSSLNLSNFPFTTIKDLEVYIDSSVSPVFYIINEAARSVWMADRKTWSNIHLKLDHIGNHVSKAQGFSNILRGISHNAVRGRCYIPSELLVTHKLSVEQILRKTETKQMK